MTSAKPQASKQLSVATWNINSVRLRMPIVERFVKESAPDILCLQEIKCQEHQFPAEEFAMLGYEHIAVHGQKGYHGVATVSKVPCREYARHDWQANGEARHVAVQLTGAEYDGMVIGNVYVPIPKRTPNSRKSSHFWAE
jgi:exodeoxyribonuclease-3